MLQVQEHRVKSVVRRESGFADSSSASLLGCSFLWAVAVKAEFGLYVLQCLLKQPDTLTEEVAENSVNGREELESCCQGLEANALLSHTRFHMDL